MNTERLESRLDMAPTAVEVDRRPDGTILLRSPQSLEPPARATGDWLVRWAAEAPERVFLAERGADGEWSELRYAQALHEVRCIGQGLLDQGASAQRPVAVLSGNSIAHALVTLGALHVGVPVVPVSPAYSLMDRSYGKLRGIIDAVDPALVFAKGAARFAPALEAIGRDATDLDSLRRPPTAEVDRAFAALGPDTVAKILFTSGSTGKPKGVINTQRMLTVNQQQSDAVWRFIPRQPPIVVDWLPWNHTFGGNYNFNLVLSHGGTMFIDGGKPVPGAFDESLRNLRQIAPTMYFNVPRGFELLLPELEQDATFRRHFFSRCEFMFYAGAALSPAVWGRIERLALQERGGDLALVSSWGSTETAPMCAGAHGRRSHAGVIGLPVPGCEIKLVPNAGKLEARVRGPNVMPGYWREPELSAGAFDEEGFYQMGDALRFADPEDPSLGLVFDGRVAEDFKLRSGTWVHVGTLRIALVDAAAPLVVDAVITGHDQDEVGALLFLDEQAAKGLTPSDIKARIAAALGRLASQRGTGSSMRVARALLMVQPPRVELGEITDKGYINQRCVREQRMQEVLRLHGSEPDPEVIVAAADVRG